MTDYASLAKEARIVTLKMIYRAQVSHLSSCFSAADILSVLFEKMNLEEDEFICSAGWKAAVVYHFLNKKGIITDEEIESYCKPGSPFIGLVEPMGRFGLKVAGGSMGIGFSMAVGMARARKLLRKKGIVYVVLSDGEMHCGNVWESVMKAAHERLDNLVAIVDNNGFCAMGKTKEILNIESLGEKWKAFGWSVVTIDGHNYNQIEDSILGGLRYGMQKLWGVFVEVADRCYVGIPRIIIASTIKGKGWKRAEGNNIFHYKAPSKDEYEEAKKELSDFPLSIVGTEDSWVAQLPHKYV